MKIIEKFENLLEKSLKNNEYFQSLSRAWQDVLFNYNMVKKNNYDTVKFTNCPYGDIEEFIKIMIDNQCEFILTSQSTAVLEIVHMALKNGMKIEHIEDIEEDFFKGKNRVNLALKFSTNK